MKSKEQLYYYMNDIVVDEYPGCCGIEVVHGFYLDKKTEYDTNWQGPGVTLDKVYKRTLKQISSLRSCRHIQLSFVTKYKNDRDFPDGQLPGFKELLLKNKWMLVDEFVNPNHGNTVAVFSKTFPKKKQPKSNRINYW